MITESTRDRDSFLYSVSAPFIEELYQAYCHNTQSVSEDWQLFFQELGAPSFLEEDDRPPLWVKRIENNHTSSQENPRITQGILDSLRALMMIRAFRVRGHLIAHLDPLKLEKPFSHPELDPKTYGFGPQDYDRSIFINHVLGFEWATLRQILHRLHTTYCGAIGIEFMHIQDPDQKSWIQERFENNNPDQGITDKQRKKILQDLIHADAFEHFLHVKFPSEKRFGLEGGESTIPALEAILAKACHQGIETIALGTAHRGRLNILGNVLGKPLHKIFEKFYHKGSSKLVYGSGDVKYHLGFSGDREIDGHKLHLSLTANPSHLEAVNPVVLGKVRAQQSRGQDTDREKAMALLIHGDAAFAGQGLVAETLELSHLEGYQTGGTIHIIINNQIGFTTSPPQSRSSPYSSDIAKAIQAPIFHVNGDDPEAVVWVSEFATEFRRQFAQDVVIDIVCYRRYGHNEIDEPSFTQPKMYRAIASHPTTRHLYTQRLIEKTAITQQEVEAITELYETKLQKDHQLAMDTSENGGDTADWLQGNWSSIKSPQYQDDQDDEECLTGISLETLQEIGLNKLKIPKDFHIHPRISRQLETQRLAIESKEGIDWATAEALAIGGLLLEHNPVRLSGQDCSRGTFSQRHATWIDQTTEARHTPLNHLRKTQALFQVVDSPLAEASVLGFEYGYSLSSPHTLVMWEAQFGDFANGAQVIIDQFIASGEIKWLRLSGLVMLLPHAYEGQGPEHTSARLERFLQLCGEDNMRVANCTTPANFFHILRRQVRSDTRKPLIVMTPKSLLRHPKAVSSLNEMQTDTAFQPVIADPVVPASKAQRVILCSGKVYYDLLEEREKQKIHNIAIIRLEQFYPFPFKQLEEILKPYQDAQIIWCQEEPMNMGAWTFLDRRLESVLKSFGARHSRATYIGRPASASPATGVLNRHIAEQQQLIAYALNLKL